MKKLACACPASRPLFLPPHLRELRNSVSRRTSFYPAPHRGINTGKVIAGTIGGGSKLEFTLIGDTLNVAARVEQLTKTTGDAILLTRSSLDALHSRPAALIERGSHALKGKSGAVEVFGLEARNT